MSGATTAPAKVICDDARTPGITEIPVQDDGTSGAIRTAVTGLPFGVDGFLMLGHDGDHNDKRDGSDVTIIAASVLTNQVIAVQPGGQPQVLLTAADGLQNPDKVALHGDRLYVSSSAYLTGTDPNMLVAHFRY